MSLADPASLSLAFRKIQGQFDSVFTPFMQQKPKFQPNCQLWSAFKPSHVPGTSANLPRLCGKCRGPNASKLPDHFPQCSSSGVVWYRVNIHGYQGEVCVPSVRDSKFGEIYKCQSCGEFMSYKSSQIAMRIIFEDLAKEIQRMVYSPDASIVMRKIKNKSPKSDADLDHPNLSEPKRRIFKWVLMLGNVVNTKFKPTLLQSICSMKIGRNRSGISESSSTDSSISKPKANLQNYECSFNIWEKKAKERSSQHQNKHSHCNKDKLTVYDDADEDFDLELLNGANPDSMWCPDHINDFGDLSLGVVSPSGPLYMCPEYLGPSSGPAGYMVPPFGPGYFESPSGPELQYLGPYYSSNYPNMMILNDSRQLMENNNVELLPRLMDIRFPQTVVDNFSMTNGNIAMNYENSFESQPMPNTITEDTGAVSSNLEIHCNNLSIEVAEFVLKTNDEEDGDTDNHCDTKNTGLGSHRSSVDFGTQYAKSGSGASDAEEEKILQEISEDANVPQPIPEKHLGTSSIGRTWRSKNKKIGDNNVYTKAVCIIMLCILLCIFLTLVQIFL